MNWVEAWNTLLVTNDLINANTGVFDPRHMFGTTNQDNFRWPALRDGTHKMLLGQYITTLQMPGIPTLLWGEEQAFYVLDNTASNYLFGRQAMSTSPAWQLHGCYSAGVALYSDFPIDAAADGCNDDSNALDHRDPTSPVRNIIKSMFQMRRRFPVLNDGYFLRQLSNHTRTVFLPGSPNTPTETGMWSTMRGRFDGVQDFTGQGPGNLPVWLVYQNDNATVTYTFDCSTEARALISPFAAHETVKNLFPPFDEYRLEASSVRLGLENSTDLNGCLSRMELPAWGFKAFVPKDQWIGPGPMLTGFVPGHDARLRSTAGPGRREEVAIEFHFSAPMDCDSITKSVELVSNTEDYSTAKLDIDSVQCSTISDASHVPYVGGLPTVMTYKANLVNVANGIHELVLRNVTAKSGAEFTDAVDRLLFRIGQPENPMIFPRTANYTHALLHKDNDTLWLSHKAAGADKFRYSLDWASSFSDWEDYHGGNTTLAPMNWTGTERQRWKDEHVIVQYWSELAGSSSHVQHADVHRHQDQVTPRRFPHLFMHGAFNQYGYDAGLANELHLDEADGRWKSTLMMEWPTASFQLSVWGINPDGRPDRSFVYGDVDGDSVLDRMPPDSLAQSLINVTAVPPSPYLAWQFELDDGNLRYELVPIGSRWGQLALFILLAVIPPLTGVIGVWLYMKSFYAIRFNEIGDDVEKSVIGRVLQRLRALFLFKSDHGQYSALGSDGEMGLPGQPGKLFEGSLLASGSSVDGESDVVRRRTVLIATLEYNIDDWALEVKIGGLGVMANLMGKSLGHQDLIWVVPCVGGLEYPEHEPAEPMVVTILATTYEVKVQYHRLRNITYVLLDAPVFRHQTKADPYPARMDDLHSGIFYSVWNQCIALTARRFPVDIYHINDYHGAIAPLHLLPDTIPVCLSLHNAEFQGSWPLKTPEETHEVCQVFNLAPELVRKYVQFGSCFNLLHAGVSYLRVNQNGFGAVGVSEKYGKRSYARYPIFWGLSRVQSLPNPDPSDTAELNDGLDEEVKIDAGCEADRAELKELAQEWAGLDVNPKAELLVFVGRWSVQKGIDLIADCFPAILKEHANVQLICVGPVIDLHGSLAAAKMGVMMRQYPGRVYSNPVFTRLPPCVFSGADFALIPSRDEPFGLVAVEFGRKGALGIGAKVGGLGRMPGWWYTVESSSATHLRRQLKLAVRQALASSPERRTMMRARSAKQRFPVAQWIADLETLHSTSITMHQKHAIEKGGRYMTTAGPSSAAFDSISTTPDPSPTPQILHRSRSPAPYTPSLLGRPAATSGNAVSLARRLATVAAERSKVSLDDLISGKQDLTLQKVDPSFNDSTGAYRENFEQNLESLDAMTSEKELCIEEYVRRSERHWQDRFRAAKLGRSGSSSSSNRRGSSIGHSRGSSSWDMNVGSLQHMEKQPFLGLREFEPADEEDQFMLGQNYEPPTGLRCWLSVRYHGWPVYSLILAFGQIISASSYQITLLEGSVGQSAEKLYAVASIYLVSSIFWWVLYRRLPSVYVLSVPFLFYGLAFGAVGLAAVVDINSRHWLQQLGTALYAMASSSGALFFVLNFGDEGGAPIKSWIFRACSIQGTQQLYNVALWFWGSTLTRSGDEAASINKTATGWVTAAITIPIAFGLWGLGWVLYVGLPAHYRESPGKIPTFYTSLLRRRTVRWFLVAVLIQNYFLSGPYGRNWQYLWSSQQASPLAIALLILLFFVGVWAGLLWRLAILSKAHPWIVPVFAIGLGAPRWCQMLWGTSNIGLYVPWAGGSPLASALVGRSLWLWLGILDSLQNVGFGMMLLQTLTHMHISFTLIAAQVLGSWATILARATAPNKIGPGDVFPDFSAGFGVGLGKGWFWVALIFQLVICAGFFRFFRKEQLSKP